MRDHWEDQKMTDVRDAAINFEAALWKLGQNSKGDWILQLHLRMPPGELPEPLFRAPQQSRWGVAMVWIGDNEELIVTPQQEVGAKAVQLAGIICHDKDFHVWLGKEVGEPIFGEDECRDTLCSVLGITSRKDLKEDAEARIQFDRMMDTYRMYRETGT